jgi:serine O-acetyltransferase
MANRKRHPTLEDNVVVYANATILGGETVIGHDTVVGGNAWVTETVPAFSIVGRHTDVRPRRPASGEEIEFNI